MAFQWSVIQMRVFVTWILLHRQQQKGHFNVLTQVILGMVTIKMAAEVNLLRERWDLDHTALALAIIIDINSGERCWTSVICRPFQRQPGAVSIRGASLFAPSGADALTSPGQDGKPDEGFSSADLSLQHGSPLPPTRSMINPTEHQRLLSPLTLSFVSPFTLPPYLLPGHFVPVYFQICFPFSPRKSRYWVSVSSHYCLLTQPPCLSVRAHSYLRVLSHFFLLIAFPLHPDFTFTLFCLLVLSPGPRWFLSILATDAFISHHHRAVCHPQLTADSSAAFGGWGLNKSTYISLLHFLPLITSSDGKETHR